MTVRRKVRVRLLQSVTYGNDNPGWQVGDIKAVPPTMAAHMVDAGEAEYINTPETTVAVNTAPERVR